MKHTPGTHAGVSETIIEMAAETIDPAMWAAIQLTKPDQPPAKTVGEVHERIAAILRRAIDMERAAELARLRAELKEAVGILRDTLADMDEQCDSIMNDVHKGRARAFLAKHGGGA